MTSNPWTPGPWKSRDRNGKFLDAGAWSLECEYSGSLHYVPVKAGKTFVAMVMAMGMPEDSDVSANARLIAAAPEMAEALELLSAAFMSHTKWNGEPPVEVVNARAILARIKGDPA